jgi:hypothetical protein
MNVAAKLGAYATGLAVAFGIAAAAGGAINPDRNDQATPTQAATGASAEGDAMSAEAMGDSGGAATSAADHGAMQAVRGLAVADAGLRLVVDRPERRIRRLQPLTFRSVDEGGHAITNYDVTHTKRMHLIVVRRDLTGFQHLHPTIDASGTWHVPLRLDEAGSYRVFADFSTDGEPRTLASDLLVDGNADLRLLPAPSSRARTDLGYDVQLDAGSIRAGQAALLRFTVTKNGAPVTVEPYLGAAGHLVALREGDLAFLHVHPSDHPETDASPEAGDTHDASGAKHSGAIAFEATFPSTGRYGLFLQFQHAGRVHTVAFTQEAR